MKELKTLVMVFLRPLERWIVEDISGTPLAVGKAKDTET